MQNLLQFLFRNGVVLLFLALEALCLYLVVETNERQNKIYHKSADVITGAISKQMESFVDYWSLRASNDSLRAENAFLRQQLYNWSLSAVSASVTDSSYRTISAHVIKNSILSRNNYITLNAGSEQGIKTGMGVVAPDGPVGIVISTTKRYAKVMSILHGNAMISASIKNKGYFGSLVWKSANPMQMQLEAIPKHANLEVGDTIITSGYSHMFPPGILIGVVEAFHLDGGDNFYNVTVRLGVDISDIQTAYVIENLHYAERDSVETLAPNE